MSTPQFRSPLYAWRRGWVVRAAILQYVLLAALLPSALGGFWGSLQVNLLLCLTAAAVVSATGQTNGVQRWTPAGLAVYLAVIAADMIVTGGVAWIVHRVARRNEISAQMLDELQEANHRLEVALAENAGLQRQLLTQAREAGVLDERQRMARKIHDTLAQGLTGIITQLQAAEGAAGEPVQWRGHHDAAISLARESLTEARNALLRAAQEALANVLFITEATVKSHLLNIYAKLGVSDRAAAVAEAFNRGLLIRRP